jgi:hypothetical protein
MRKLIRWGLLIAAAVTVAYLLSAGAETHSTRASIDPPRRPARISAEKTFIPVAPGAPSFATAASQGVRELIQGAYPVGWKPETGLWGGHTRPNWWQSALAVQALVRYLERTGNVEPVYQAVLLQIYDRNVYKPLSTAKRDFANEFMDDTAWWGMAWLEAARYELRYRHDVADARKFLAVAEYDVRYIVAAPRQCGGIVWALRRSPDMVTSAEFVSLAARLASFRQTRGVFYNPELAGHWLTDARYVLDWLRKSGMVDLKWGYVFDRIKSCRKFVGGPLTYTEGEMADALTELGIAEHKPIYFRYASRFIRYVLNYRSHLISHGVVAEYCELLPGSCHENRNRLDVPSFKGIFIQAVSDWSAATHRKTFLRFLHNQAAAVVDNAIVTTGNRPGNCASPSSCQFAFIWARELKDGPPPVPPTVATQTSAIAALTAALPAKRGTQTG